MTIQSSAKSVGLEIAQDVGQGDDQRAGRQRGESAPRLVTARTTQR